MHEYLLDSLAKTVSYLSELKDILLRAMMNDFYVAIDSYVSVLRDQTDDQFNGPQVGAISLLYCV